MNTVNMYDQWQTFVEWRVKIIKYNVIIKKTYFPASQIFLLSSNIEEYNFKTKNFSILNPKVIKVQRRIIFIYEMLYLPFDRERYNTLSVFPVAGHAIFSRLLLTLSPPFHAYLQPNASWGLWTSDDVSFQYRMISSIHNTLF